MPRASSCRRSRRRHRRNRNARPLRPCARGTPPATADRRARRAGRRIAAIDRVGDFVGFLDRVRRDRVEILFAHPTGSRARGSRSARHDAQTARRCRQRRAWSAVMRSMWLSAPQRAQNSADQSAAGSPIATNSGLSSDSSRVVAQRLASHVEHAPPASSSTHCAGRGVPLGSRPEAQIEIGFAARDAGRTSATSPAAPCGVRRGCASIAPVRSLRMRAAARDDRRSPRAARVSIAPRHCRPGAPFHERAAARTPNAARRRPAPAPRRARAGDPRSARC